MLLHKQQLHLKTIHLNQWFGINKDHISIQKTQKNKQSVLKYKAYNKTRSHSITSNLLNKKAKPYPHCKLNTTKNQILNTLKNVQINRYDCHQLLSKHINVQLKSNYRQFPKREKIIKNSNAFKFFLNSTIHNRTYTQHLNPPLQMKITTDEQVDIKEQNVKFTGKYLKCPQSAREINKKRIVINRPQSVSFHKIFHKAERCQTVEPWDTFQNHKQQVGNEYAGDF